MSILHTLKRKLRSCRRQQDGVLLSLQSFISPPILAMSETSPFLQFSLKSRLFVPIFEVTTRDDHDSQPIVRGWSYVRWRHFIAHILVAGWPDLSDEASLRSFRYKILLQIGIRCCPAYRFQSRDSDHANPSNVSWKNDRVKLTENGCARLWLRTALRIFRSCRFHTCKSSPVGCEKHRMNDHSRGCESSTVLTGAAV